ncbi:hypothetical protein [uncultured Endozoicomonas sp.]|uniref:hypothetical protein n=1 Tax=uncultured Endozoicomonas sp. TaxID=432652 RepID=UPI00262DFB93|nr:hypothetical protein [uncultured Endozoicomonas sp.]
MEPSISIHSGLKVFYAPLPKDEPTGDATEKKLNKAWQRSNSTKLKKFVKTNEYSTISKSLKRDTGILERLCEKHLGKDRHIPTPSETVKQVFEEQQEPAMPEAAPLLLVRSEGAATVPVQPESTPAFNYAETLKTFRAKFSINTLKPTNHSNQQSLLDFYQRASGSYHNVIKSLSRASEQIDAQRSSKQNLADPPTTDDKAARAEKTPPLPLTEGDIQAILNKLVVGIDLCLEGSHARFQDMNELLRSLSYGLSGQLHKHRSDLYSKLALNYLDELKKRRYIIPHSSQIHWHVAVRNACCGLVNLPKIDEKYANRIKLKKADIAATPDEYATQSIIRKLS